MHPPVTLEQRVQRHPETGRSPRRRRTADVRTGGRDLPATTALRRSGRDASTTRTTGAGRPHESLSTRLEVPTLVLPIADVGERITVAHVAVHEEAVRVDTTRSTTATESLWGSGRSHPHGVLPEVPLHDPLSPDVGPTPVGASPTVSPLQRPPPGKRHLVSFSATPFGVSGRPGPSRRIVAYDLPLYSI